MKSKETVNFYRHISLQVKSLKLLGIWLFLPQPVKSFRFWLDASMKLFLVIFIFIVPTFAQIVYFIKLIMSGTAAVDEIASIANLMLTELMTSLKLLDLGLRRGAFADLIEQLLCNKAYLTGRHTVILEKAITSSRKLFYLLLFCTYFNVSIHMVVVPPLSGFKKLPLKMDFIFFDTNDDAYFKYIYIFQLLYKPTMITSCVALLSLPWSLMIYTISQLDVLIYNFENINLLVKETQVEQKCEMNEAFKKVFKQCLDIHSDITRFVERLQSFLSGQFTITIVSSATIICTTVVQILAIDDKLHNLTSITWSVVYLHIIIFMLFFDCYYGNSIIEKSAHLGTVTYACPWPELSKDQKKNILIFMTRVQKPFVIVAASIIPVSIDTFTKVMNWTYNAYAVMNQMK